MPRPTVSDRRGVHRPEIGRAKEAAISVVVTRAPDPGDLARVNGVASQLEVRADLAGDLDPGEIREHFDGSLVYSLRSEDHGGRSDDTTGERRRRLLASAEGYDLVDLEHGGDLDDELLSRIPPSRRRVSWRGPASDVDGLRARFDAMSQVSARGYVVAPEARSVEDGLAPLQLLQSVRGTDVTAFATGVAGMWSRLLAPRLGARVAYGRLEAGEDPGMPTVRQLTDDYGFPHIGPLRDLFGFVGASASRSLALRIYNHGYRSLALPALCLPFMVDNLDSFWGNLIQEGLPGLGVPVRALTVVSPNKERALDIATIATERAREAGAANSLVRAGGAWQAGSTTRLAASVEEVRPGGRDAAVIGCGGAVRSIAAELRRHGARVTLVNRGEARGEFASRLLDLPWTPLAGFSARDYGIVVNATPLAREAPFAVYELDPGAAVVDLAYLPDRDTALSAAARARGNLVVDGRRILAAETAWQFQYMTGQPMPADALALALGEQG
jgi:3-dehydroquinate dehydratase / shikimate dehydrogenase